MQELLARDGSLVRVGVLAETAKISLCASREHAIQKNSHKNAVFAHFCDKNAVFAHFATKMLYLLIFVTKMPSLQICMTKMLFLHFLVFANV